MHLAHVRIEHFRGIKRLDVPLDQTTVVVGEGNTGKASLLDALEICLGIGVTRDRFAFAREDLHVPEEGAGTGDARPIRVDLTFREKAKGQWSASDFDRLRAVMIPGRADQGQIRLRVIAEPGADETGLDVRWSFHDGQGRRVPGAQPVEVLAELRRRNPFILVKTNRPPAQIPPPAAEAAPRSERDSAPGQRSDEDVIAEVAKKLQSSRRTVPRAELAAGLDAAGTILAQLARRYGREESASGARLVSDLVEIPLRPRGGRRTAAHGLLPGSGLRSLSILMLLSALLDARGDATVDADAEPIVAIEKPETHLHPISVASMWSVIGGFDAQRIITTNSGSLLAQAPLTSIRRLQRRGEDVRVHRVGPRDLTAEERRRIGYHIRAMRGGAFFARCWLLIEGETEFWLIPELARICGYDFAAEGVRCIEFAQCGVQPQIKIARCMGIEWHLLTDGDRAGRGYLDAARDHLGKGEEPRRITRLRERDLEHCLWFNGFERVYREAAGGRYLDPGRGHGGRRTPPSVVINKAIRSSSKPALALTVAEAAAARGARGVPKQLREMVERVIGLARGVGG